MHAGFKFFQLSYHYLPSSSEECTSISQLPSCYLGLHFSVCLYNRQWPPDVRWILFMFLYQAFPDLQTKKLSIFAWLIFVFLVHCVSFVKHQSSRQFFVKNESINPGCFLFPFFRRNFGICRLWNLPTLAEEKKHSLRLFPWKRSEWQNPDQERTNQIFYQFSFSAFSFACIFLDPLSVLHMNRWHFFDHISTPWTVGVLQEKLGKGVWSASQTLALFMKKSAMFAILFMTWPKIWNPI